MERLAEVICGGGQGYEDAPGVYRTAGHLGRFFRKAGVEAPDFSGSRKWWVLDVVRSLNEEPEGLLLPEGIEKVLLALVDDAEYGTELSKLFDVISYLNNILVNYKTEIAWDDDGARYALKGLDEEEFKEKRSVIAELAREHRRQRVEAARTGESPIPAAVAVQPETAPGPGSESQIVACFGLLHVHPRIRKASEPLFRDGHYGQAVLEAFKAVNNSVKEKSARGDLDGKALMAEVFRPESATLRLNELKTKSDRDEQEGDKFLYMGAQVGIRNPKAHEEISQMEAADAFKLIAFASHLCQRVDDANLP